MIKNKKEMHKMIHTRLYNCLGLLKIVTTLPIPEPQTPIVTLHIQKEGRLERCNYLFLETLSTSMWNYRQAPDLLLPDQKRKEGKKEKLLCKSNGVPWHQASEYIPPIEVNTQPECIKFLPPVAITPSSLTAIALIIVFCWELLKVPTVLEYQFIIRLGI